MTPAEQRATPATRRTQKQRREATIGRLLDATASALVEVGYSRTTIREICLRAGVSDGGLFRHFGSRLDVIVACAEHVANQTLGQLRELVDATPPTDQTPQLIVLSIRAATRQPNNYVWQELLTAARTDPELRLRIQPAARRYIADAGELMLTVAGADALPPHQAGVWQQLLTHVFNSEALVAAVTPDPEADERLAAFLTTLLAAAMPKP